MLELKVASTLALMTGFGAFGGALTMVQSQGVVGDQTLIPLGIVVSLFIAAIVMTVKVVRLVDAVVMRLDVLEKLNAAQEVRHDREDLEDRVKRLEEAMDG
jgi:hypothetical protein